MLRTEREQKLYQDVYQSWANRIDADVQSFNQKALEKIAQFKQLGGQSEDIQVALQMARYFEAVIQPLQLEYEKVQQKHHADLIRHQEDIDRVKKDTPQLNLGFPKVELIKFNENVIDCHDILQKQWAVFFSSDLNIKRRQLRNQSDGSELAKLIQMPEETIEQKQQKIESLTNFKKIYSPSREAYQLALKKKIEFLSDEKQREIVSIFDKMASLHPYKALWMGDEAFLINELIYDLETTIQLDQQAAEKNDNKKKNREEARAEIAKFDIEYKNFIGEWDKQSKARSQAWGKALREIDEEKENKPLKKKPKHQKRRYWHSRPAVREKNGSEGGYHEKTTMPPSWKETLAQKGLPRLILKLLLILGIMMESLIQRIKLTTNATGQSPAQEHESITIELPRIPSRSSRGIGDWLRRKNQEQVDPPPSLQRSFLKTLNAKSSIQEITSDTLTSQPETVRPCI